MSVLPKYRAGTALSATLSSPFRLGSPRDADFDLRISIAARTSSACPATATPGSWNARIAVRASSDSVDTDFFMSPSHIALAASQYDEPRLTTGCTIREGRPIYSNGMYMITAPSPGRCLRSVCAARLHGRRAPESPAAAALPRT